ncbi:hypothetical protein [Nonlabens sp. Asnod2-A12]|uniref:hypothetical protein n=1 Tax=Nonlabens sp. Asnod2-A12 TaxID=3160578 RepID=UPI00386F4B6D
MEILSNIQEFINANFVRLGFVIILFIYFLSLLPKISSKIALQIMRFLILINCLFNWLLVITSFFTDQAIFSLNRLNGPYSSFYIIMLLGSLILPLVLFIPKAGSKVWILFLVSLLSNIGFWMERWVIIVTSIHRDYLPPTHTAEIDLMLGTQALVLAHSLFIAVIFVLLGTWLENHAEKLKLKTTFFK